MLEESQGHTSTNLVKASWRYMQREESFRLQTQLESSTPGLIEAFRGLHFPQETVGTLRRCQQGDEPAMSNMVRKALFS